MAIALKKSQQWETWRWGRMAQTRRVTHPRHQLCSRTQVWNQQTRLRWRRRGASLPVQTEWRFAHQSWPYWCACDITVMEMWQVLYLFVFTMFVTGRKHSWWCTCVISLSYSQTCFYKRVSVVEGSSKLQPEIRNMLTFHWAEFRILPRQILWAGYFEFLLTWLSTRGRPIERKRLIFAIPSAFSLSTPCRKDFPWVDQRLWDLNAFTASAHGRDHQCRPKGSITECSSHGSADAFV